MRPPGLQPGLGRLLSSTFDQLALIPAAPTITKAQAASEWIRDGG